VRIKSGGINLKKKKKNSDRDKIRGQKNKKGKEPLFDCFWLISKKKEQTDAKKERITEMGQKENHGGGNSPCHPERMLM